MTVYVLIQSGNADTHWTSLFLRGIKTEAKAHGYGIVEAESDGLTLPDSFRDARAVLAIGSSFEWMNTASEMLRSVGRRPVLVGCANQNGIHASGFAVADYERATRELLDYFVCHGKRRVALFGVNGDSAADLLKMKAFLSYNGNSYTYNDVFFFRGSTINLCESLLPLIQNYDAIISANDVSGFMLIQTLQKSGIKVPEDVFVASFGDVNYRKNLSSRLTVATLDGVRAGRASVEIYNRINAEPTLSYITVKMHCDIDVRESTDFLPFDSTPAAPVAPRRTAFDLFADSPLTEMMLAEKILSECDPLDLEILRGIHAGLRNADIADMLHASESTVKYRIKRLLNRGNIASRSEMMSIMSSYLE